MVRIRKVFSDAASHTPYAAKIQNVTIWFSEEDLIQLVAGARKLLPKKVQVPFSENSMPAGEMKVMVSVV